jgi:hypothetical protein
VVGTGTTELPGRVSVTIGSDRPGAASRWTAAPPALGASGGDRPAAPPETSGGGSYGRSDPRERLTGLVAPDDLAGVESAPGGSPTQARLAHVLADRGGGAPDLRTNLLLRATLGIELDDRGGVAMLSPGAREAIDREQAMRLLAELAEVQGRLDRLNGRLRELATRGDTSPVNPHGRHARRATSASASRTGRACTDRRAGPGWQDVTSPIG